MKITISIADDHPLVISGLQHIIDTHPDMEMLRSYNNGAELLSGIRESMPHVLLLDIQMPGQTGDEIAAILAAEYPDLKIIALTNQDDLYYINSMLAAGVAGYILKTTSAEVLIEAILAVCNGGGYVEQSIKDKLRQQQIHMARVQEETPALSRREREVLRYVAENLTSQEIADKLFLSKRTVDNYRQSLLTKFRAKNGGALIKIATELGLLS